jgi:hypothetical protein
MLLAAWQIGHSVRPKTRRSEFESRRGEMFKEFTKFNAVVHRLICLVIVGLKNAKFKECPNFTQKRIIV